MNVASAVMPRKDSTGRCFWSSCGKAAVGPPYSTPPPGRLLRKAFQVHHSSQRSSLIADPEADRFICASWCHTESICRMADVGFAATSVPPTPQHSLSYPLNDQPWATVHSQSPFHGRRTVCRLQVYRSDCALTDYLPSRAEDNLIPIELQRPLSVYCHLVSTNHHL